MISIKVICTGKLKERFYIDASDEYTKRLGSYCKLDIKEIPEQRLSDKPSEAEVSAALEKESKEFEANLPAGCTVAALCVEGRRMSSPELAEFITDRMGSGSPRLCFLIGGSRGLHDSIKKRADIKLSMSDMTFPHHLARIMLLEQLYRAFKINEGGKYHK